MKLIYLPLEAEGSTDRGTARAFKNFFGNDCVEIIDYYSLEKQGRSRDQINAHLKERVALTNPDWVHGQYQDSEVIYTDTIKELKERFAHICFSHWTGDMRAFISNYMSRMSEYCDLTTVSSIGQIPAWQTAGARSVMYWQIAVDYEIDCRIDRPPMNYAFKAPEIVFCGRYYHNMFPGASQRLEMAEALVNEYGDRFGIVGSNFPRNVLGSTGVKEQRDIYRQAKLSIGCNNFNEIELYYSDRQLCAMAAGICHVCRYVPSLEREFRDMEHCVFWRTKEELLEKVKWLLANDRQRMKIGLQGRGEILRNHTWYSRIQEIIPVIERKIAEIRT